MSSPIRLNLLNGVPVDVAAILHSHTAAELAITEPEPLPDEPILGGTLSCAAHILRTIPGAVFLLDLRMMYYSFANNYIENLCGLPSSELTGKFTVVGPRFLELIHKDDRARWLHFRDTFFSKLVGPHIKANGSVHYRVWNVKRLCFVWIHTSMHYWELDSLPLVTGILSEATELMETREALQESQRVRTAMLSSLHGGVFRCSLRGLPTVTTGTRAMGPSETDADAEWTVLWANEGWCDLTGASLTEPLTLREIVHAEDYERVHLSMLTALEGARSLSTQYRIISKDGHLRWIWHDVTPVSQPGSGGRVLEGIVIDVTHQQQEQHAQEAQRLTATLKEVRGMWAITVTDALVEHLQSALLSLGRLEESLEQTELRDLAASTEASIRSLIGLFESEQSGLPLMNTRVADSAERLGMMMAEAARRGSAIDVSKYLAQGASPKWKSPAGNTPLHYAATANDPSVVAVLLDAGTPRDARDAIGRTALYVAAFSGCPDVIRFLLKEKNGKDGSWAHGIDAPAMDGSSPLHGASYAGHLSCIHELLNHGANANAVDHDGRTPLHWTAARGWVDATSALVAGGARIEAVAGGAFCLTPLHTASAMGHLQTVICLLNMGANPLCEDSMNRTASMVAQDSQVIAILQEAEKKNRQAKVMSLPLDPPVVEPSSFESLSDTSSEEDEKDPVVQSILTTMEHATIARGFAAHDVWRNLMGFHQALPQLHPNPKEHLVEPAQWSLCETIAWLSEIDGFEQYVPLFVRERIDGEALVELTEQNLRNDLFLTLGHTKKLLKRIRSHPSIGPDAKTNPWVKLLVKMRRLNEGLGEAPPHLKCPIVGEVMADPVVACDGLTYERASIQLWWYSRPHQSPVTNERLAAMDLVENVGLADEIRLLRPN